MKRIKKEELPKVLTEEIIEVLANMIDEIPQSKEWHEIFEILSLDDYDRIEKKRSEIQKHNETQRKASMSPEEKEEQALKRKKMLEKLERDPHTFYGNMGQPETPQEYNNRYGVWPPGFDQETGERLPNNPE